MIFQKRIKQWKEIDESEIEIENYDHFYSLSNYSRTDGLKKIKENIIDNKHWFSVYTAKFGKTSLIIIAVYRSKSGSKAEFCDNFQDIVEEMCERNNDILIVGDFNIDRKNDFYASKLESVINDIMNEYTRIRESSKTLIDYIITNNKSITAKNNISKQVSDHESIENFIGNNYVAIEYLVKEKDIFIYNKNSFNNEITYNI